MRRKNELETMRPAVLAAGAAILPYFEKAKSYQITEKSRHNPVTDADYAANDILVRAIHKAFPGDAILSEETSDSMSRASMDEGRAGHARVWIIDPLDGTKEFLEGRPDFAVSVGLVEDGEPVLGFLYNPARNLMVEGGDGLGVTANNRTVSPPEPVSSVSELRVCLSWSEYHKGLFDDLKGILTISADSILGSIAYKLALVAQGSFHLTVSRKPKNEWDIAGGMALFRELGYILRDGDNREIPLNKADTLSRGLIAGSPSAVELYLRAVVG